MRADYTHTIAINDVTGEELVRRPRHKASLNVAWTGIDKLTTSATILYVSSWKDVDRFGLAPAPFSTTPYTLVNLAANYTIDEHAAVFARVDNLFNKHYQDPVGFERPGLGAYAGFRLTN
jgi:vitamin B12 transporter